MSFLLYFLPTTLFLLSVGCLWVNLKQPKGLLLAIGLSSLGFLILGGNILVAYLSQSDQDKLLTRLEEEQAWRKAQISKQLLFLSRMGIEEEAPEEGFKKYANMGITFSNTFFNKINAANDSLNQLFADEENPLNLNPSVAIYRIPGSTNQAHLAQYFESLGYKAFYTEPVEYDEDADPEEYIVREESEEAFEAEDLPDIQDSLSFNRSSQYQPPFNLTSFTEANILYYGSRVGSDDVKVIALLAIRAGINLKGIKHHKRNTEQNASIIEFGWSKFYARRASLTPEKVLSKKSY